MTAQGGGPHVGQMACRREELAVPGDFVEYEICDQSVLVVRQRDGSINASENACRPRDANSLSCRTAAAPTTTIPNERQQRGLHTRSFERMRLATEWERLMSNMHEELDHYLTR